jgi:phage-related protein
MIKREKPLVWLEGEVKTPPFSSAARIEAGYLLRQLQQGIKLSLPQAWPMPSIGRRCLELRIIDERSTWRIILRVDQDAIVILHVFSKKSKSIPKTVIDVCKKRLKAYDELG